MFQPIATPLTAAASSAVRSTRGMATLKQVSMRLKSVKNIQKITASMKMVSAAKFARAERELRAARPIGEASSALVNKAEINLADDAKKQVYVAISSDRGLCGGIHSAVSKKINLTLREQSDSIESKIVVIGDKARSILQRTQGDKIILSCSEVGKKQPTFKDASYVAQELLKSGYEYSIANIVYNHFKSAIAYQTTSRPVPSVEELEGKEEMNIFDDVDSDVLQSYMEYTLASNIHYTMLESAASEQSARMSAMENATNNATEMIDNLTLLFNRTRQAVITRELIEIISGAAALD
jgi:F-type H+-transporting ATPase subunit gamma